MREAKQVKRLRSSSARRPIGPAKFNEPGLVWVERESELREALWQHLEDAPRVVLPSEDQDGIVRVADEVRTPSQARHDLRGEPLVEDHVQVDVREQWR